MAQFTINIPDDKLARILTAFGKRDPFSQEWIDATPAYVRDLLKAYLKAQVVNHEMADEVDIIRTNKSLEPWD